MNADCHILNPLQRDGVSRLKRMVDALATDYAQVDERKLLDLLSYLRSYAAELRYFNLDNQSDGDWQAFLEKDLTILLAQLAEVDAEKERTQMQALRQAVKQAAPAAEKAAAFGDMFGPIAAQAERLNRWYQRAVPELGLHRQLQRLIQSAIGLALRQLLGYAERSQELGISIPPIATHPYGEIWGLEALLKVYTLIPEDDLTEEAFDAAADRLYRTYEPFFEAIIQLQEKIDDFLQESLTQYPQHEPHMALLLAFLQLYEYAREHLNTLTGRHLDFYFRDILQLDNKAAQPDSVHVVFELAKQVEEEKIAAKTRLKAGKDGGGNKRTYQTDEELIANKVSLEEAVSLKTLFLEKKYPFDLEGPPSQDTSYTIQQLYAAPVANSADGEGAELESEDGKWPSLGSTDHPKAQLGFAVASPMLYLSEGDRDITLTFTFKNTGDTPYGNGDGTENGIAHELQHNLQVYYTAEKEWLPLAISKLELQESGEQLTVTIQLSLPAGTEAMVAYAEKAHQDGLQSSYPVLKFMLDADGLSADYLCFDQVVLETEEEALTNIPAARQELLLTYLNGIQKWEDLAGVEPQLGPILDGPETGYSTPKSKGYDIGQATAEKLLKERAKMPNQRFATMQQLIRVPGIGVDKMNDLLYSLCQSQVETSGINQVKAQAKEFQPEVAYAFGQFVTYQGSYYRCLQAGTGYEPDLNPAYWLPMAFSHPYRHLKPLELQQLTIALDVQNMQNLIIENDQGQQNSAKPFLPFGPVPKVGSRLYIGSPEVFSKPISEVSLKLNWGDLPEVGFRAHYKHYQDATTGSDGAKVPGSEHKVGNNHHFNMDFSLVYKGKIRGVSDSPLSTSSQKLFANATGVPNQDREFKVNFSNYERLTDLPDFTALDKTLPRGFLAMELQQDFLHKQYPRYLSKAALSQEVGLLPNEPYTPLIDGFFLSYQASHTIDYQSLTKGEFEDRVEQLFCFFPFGQSEIWPVRGEDVETDQVLVRRKLVPEFWVKVKDPDTGAESELDAEGNLFIGLKGVDPEQNLSMLIQMAEGSADPDASIQEVVWSYLSNNHWVDFKTDQILADGTNGLLTSGIVKLTLPKAINDDNSILPAGYYWLKASVAKETRAISQSIALHPQAVKATFVDENNDPAHYQQALEAAQISKLESRKAAIKKVTQPYASFGGRPEEEDEAYYTRISERLRHKQRAINIYDYERLVLEAFPEVYKVRCLNHTRSQTEFYSASEYAPGYVKVVVLPDLRNRNAVDPFAPRLSLNSLEEIKAFLTPLLSDFINLEVKNATFEGIEADFQVKYRKGYDQGFYDKQLVQDIIRFLSPWLYDEGADLQFGGKMHRSMVLDYVEERPYVDFVTDFKLYHHRDDKRVEVEEAIPSTSSSVLVSHTTHAIGHNISSKCLSQPTS
jgi:hypothetical protein